jgi:hypothetical protein
MPTFSRFDDARYEVLATRGNSIVFRAFYENYDDAMDILSFAEEEYKTARVEFIDHAPFFKRS